jgi:hypothetical protein
MLQLLQLRAAGQSRSIKTVRLYWCGRSLVVKPQPSKLMMRVRFPPPAFQKYFLIKAFAVTAFDLTALFTLWPCQVFPLFGLARPWGALGVRAARGRCGFALMPFELAFHPEALREWRTLRAGIRQQFKQKQPAWSTRCGITSSWCLSWRWASGTAMLYFARPTSAEERRRLSDSGFPCS